MSNPGPPGETWANCLQARMAREVLGAYEGNYGCGNPIVSGGELGLRQCRKSIAHKRHTEQHFDYFLAATIASVDVDWDWCKPAVCGDGEVF
jgi:hypothetical protein